MARLEELQPNAAIAGITPDALVTVVTTQWFGSEALELTYKDSAGPVAQTLLYRTDEPRLAIAEAGRPWSFNGDGAPDCRWDMIVCDEAHKLSATFFGGEVKYTKRYPKLETILSRPEFAWINRGLEQTAQQHAISRVVPEHLQEVRGRRVEWIQKRTPRSKTA